MQRCREQPWRSWYNTKEWRELRALVFKRDGLVCQQTGVLCIGKHPDPHSPVADHKIPHRGDRALFFDPNNLETVTKRYHDSVKQSLERRGLAGQRREGGV
ncbi:MAG: HNH endonuclease [Pseudomonadota bacterium]